MTVKEAMQRTWTSYKDAAEKVVKQCGLPPALLKEYYKTRDEHQDSMETFKADMANTEDWQAECLRVRSILDGRHSLELLRKNYFGSQSYFKF